MYETKDKLNIGQTLTISPNLKWKIISINRNGWMSKLYKYGRHFKMLNDKHL